MTNTLDLIQHALPTAEAAQHWYVEAAKSGNEGALSWCRENGVNIQG